VWRRGVARLAQRPWAAALVAQHAITVYDRYRADPAWAAFFADMEAARSAMVAAGTVPMDALAADYPFVRLGDLISLAFCTASAETHTIGAWTVRYADARVVVAPDVFGGAVVPMAVQARELPARTWADDEELRAAVAAAPWSTVDGSVAGA
jgi:hypothetical protein